MRSDRTPGGRSGAGSRGSAVACGALAGAIAANSMTLLRMAARRAGLIEKTVPQVIEEWLVARLGVRRPRGPVGHHALDQLMHVGYGSLIGALDGLLARDRPALSLKRGLGLGAATWFVGAFILMPSMGVTRAPWRTSLRENMTNLLAHLAFGIGNALLTEELFRQIEHGPVTPAEHRATRVG